MLLRLTIAAACLATWTPALGFDEDSPKLERCMNHPSMKLQDYVAGYERDKFGQAYDRYVPADLKILENFTAEYVSNGTTLVQNLPVDDDRYYSSNRYRVADVFFSACRIVDGAGMVWVVPDRRAGSMQYIKASDVEAMMEAAYTIKPKGKPAVFAKAALACEIGEMSLTKYIGASYDVRRRYSRDFRRVPRDRPVEQGQLSLVLPQNSAPHILPHATSFAADELPAGTSISSPCRVRDEGGAWWAAYDTGNALAYLPMSDLRAADRPN